MTSSILWVRNVVGYKEKLPTFERERLPHIYDPLMKNGEYRMRTNREVILKAQYKVI